MSDHCFDSIRENAPIPNIESYTSNLARFAHDHDLSEASLADICSVFEHIAELKNEAIVNTLLKMSRCIAVII